MAKYAKPKRRLEKKGLRPLPPYAIDEFPQKKFQKGEERFERILENTHPLDKKGEFLQRYCLTVCQFRLAVENRQPTDPILREIYKMENEGHDVGFSQEELWAINRIFREKKGGELESLQQKLAEKVGAK